MKSKLTILFLCGSLLVPSFLASQVKNNDTAPATTPLTEEQESLFDTLLEKETRVDPRSARILQEDPEKAAEIVEITGSSESGGEAVESPPAKSPVIGTFIQLTRKWGTLSEDDWSKILDIVEYAGMTKIIIQWTASETIAYFEPAPEAYTETYPVINRLFSALQNRDIEVVLGLDNDPDYWRIIETRNDVRDVYFRVQNTRNLRIQEALLEQFDSVERWTGYYISEEIDDLNWREPASEEVFHQFLLRGGRIIRERDEDRTISISSFFRKRTAPSTFANNLADLMSSTQIDRLWIQDGIGVSPMGSSLIAPYFQVLKTRFSGLPTRPGIVAELFETTFNPDEPFAAQTALAGRVERQFRDASILGGPIVVFSLFDYADPRKGGTEREIYELIRAWNLEAVPSFTAVSAVDPITKEPEEPEIPEDPKKSTDPNDPSELLNDLRRSRMPPEPAADIAPPISEEKTPTTEEKPLPNDESTVRNEKPVRIEPLTGLRIPVELLPPPTNRNETVPQESPSP